MKILITSGGTTENIDSVRGITNHSTGNLGKIIAERFLNDGHQVTLITTKHAVKPATHDNLNIHLISNVDSLLKTLEPLVMSHDVLIHSMAVSDYTPVYMTTLEELEQVDSPAQLLSKRNSETKISSTSDSQILFLKKTPKVISLVKEWNPDIRLIGFKLLVDVEKAELFEVARASLAKNHAEFIVANDLKDISSEQHVAYLVDQTSETRADSKRNIAEMIYERVISHG